ncbi:MAG: hypothetical protein QHJ34_01165 [bacterium]|jgi:hypothetical protein|nr:hypothetical protein [candidate division KSB1 bacterium]MDH7558828.1 hypothetical protein [bacterium]
MPIAKVVKVTLGIKDHFVASWRGQATPALTPSQFLQEKLPQAPSSLPFLPPVILDRLPLCPAELLHNPHHSTTERVLPGYATPLGQSA